MEPTVLTLELVSVRTTAQAPAAPKPQEEVWGSPFLPKAHPKTAVPAPAPPVSGPSIVASEPGPPHLYSVAELAKPPQPLVKVKPAYPIEARRLGIEGVVTFQVDIDATGAVKKVTLVKGLGHGCDQAAMEALWKTPFSPGIAPDGQVVPVQRPYSFGFDLNDVDGP